MKIPRKCHNHKAQPFQGIKRRRDEEQMTEHEPRIESLTHKEEMQQRNCLETVSRKTILSRAGVGVNQLYLCKTSSLSHDASPKIKEMQIERTQKAKWSPFGKDDHNASLTTRKQKAKWAALLQVIVMLYTDKPHGLGWGTSLIVWNLTAEPKYTLYKQCRSRSVGFFWSQVICICTTGC